jgi:hypothetical protein
MTVPEGAAFTSTTITAPAAQEDPTTQNPPTLSQGDDTGSETTPTPTQGEVVKSSVVPEDNEELVDGIIYQPDTCNVSSKDNTEDTIVSSKDNIEDTIQLQKPGVQLTVFHYNILPTVGNVYKVNSKFNLEKVKYSPGKLYLADEEGTLSRVYFPPFQVYQADHEGTLKSIGVADGPITSS